MRAARSCLAFDAVTRTAESIEHACADVWPALTETTMGQWRLRAAGGFTGRANAVLAVGSPGRPLREALDEVTEFYAGHGLPPRLQVLAATGIEDGLRAAGWRTDPAHCGERGVAVLLGPLHAPLVAGTITAEPPAGWWPLVTGGDDPSAAQRQVLTAYEPLGYGLAERDGVAVAAVRGAVHGELLHFGKLSVVPEARRGGLATGLLGALYQWGACRGARRCVLQVDPANEAALRLYTRLGCVQHHRYRYWIPPAR